MVFLNISSFILIFLEKKGAKKFPHIKQGTLYDHLVRVGERLKSWELEKKVIYAGYCHSLYATQVFTESLVSVEHRDELGILLGDDAESLVYYFSIMDRKTLAEKDGVFSFLNYKTKEKVVVPVEDFTALVHILLANEIDHIVPQGLGYKLATFRSFLRWKHLLSEKAQLALNELCSETGNVERKETNVQFIGHAGIKINFPDLKILIDPWIYVSNFTNPLIYGLSPEAKTIDYLIPEPRSSIEELKADVILLSHLHTHHSPLREIRELAVLQPITIICPKLKDGDLVLVERNLGKEVFDNITFHFLDKDEDFPFGDTKVRAISHTQKNHFAYLVSNKEESVLHIADAAVSVTSDKGTFDAVWDKFYNLYPSFLFLSAASHAQRVITDKSERDILENTTFSPVQAAKLTRKILPKQVGLIGMYNFSIWTNRLEHSLPASISEEAFYWALSYLAPGVEHRILRPGNIFDLNLKENVQLNP